ncbi:hypothetical protein KAFR_0H02230 [Kazachstania africana CBS 2517]|uniref:U6 snRNA phosphodiesterase n=1 Tax=Kazachstania africana (strain ATCC 22294 / BCRC 22015 / CBS 2517 / CECT 1963 / NBRC 1671 / NRRL Y-8276) TaxID=1071382 RepID=H2AZ76_KAZAF|nr:hypothetical protein KAFR_0H02230 [Kazachstania africana CBS 2517]CCF59632.1 hypothetical protein KAFR_0H02230 [Kazachstania africana CBS 2517]
MNLLRDDYGSETSDSDTVNSESSGSDPSLKVKRRKVQGKQAHLPPVPDSIGAKYHIEPNITKFEHEEMSLQFKIGQWTSFIYLQWKPTAKQRILFNEIISDYNQLFNDKFKTKILDRFEFKPTYRSDLGSPHPLHVSLSRNLTFNKQERRDEFITTLAGQIKAAQINPFQLQLQSRPQLFQSQFDATTLFLVLPLDPHTIKKQITNLHEVIKRTMIQYALPRNFLEASRSHVTIAQLDNVPRRVMSKIDQISPSKSYAEVSSMITPSITHLHLDKNRESFQLPF